MKAISEDQRVVEAQRPEMLTYELATHSDVLQVAYRKLLQKCLDMGWGVDRHQINSGDSDLQTVVIPSPVRHQVAELTNTWKIEEISI